MESRAKQRLTGAIILVALFVLLVPELLTGPGNSHPDDRSSGQSASEQGMRSYTIDLDGQKAPNASSATTAQPSVSLPPVTAPTSPSPERAVPGEAAAPEPAPTSVPPVATSPNPTPAPQTMHPGNPRNATPVRPAEAGNFAVQLGTFGKRENADKLARDMTAKGFAAFVVPTTTNGHELYRVRVGPAHDRAAAEALATELKRVGQPGSIVPIS